LEHSRRPAQLACGERDFGLGDDTPRAGHRFFRTESARGVSKKRLCSHEIAKLCHRNAAKCKRRRIIAQGNPLQCSERIPRRERTCCGG
jgi:hypothetical protein